MNLVSSKDVKVFVQRNLSADFPEHNFGGQEIKEEFSRKIFTHIQRASPKLF